MNGRLNGKEFQFVAGGQTYRGTIDGNPMTGKITTPSGETAFKATKS